MERPAIRLSGPCVEAPDVPALVRFYERFLGWEVEELVGPRHDRSPRWGWGRLRPADKAPGQKMKVQWPEHYQQPVWPGEPAQPTIDYAVAPRLVGREPRGRRRVGDRVRGRRSVAAAEQRRPLPYPDHAGPRRPPVLPLDVGPREQECVRDRTTFSSRSPLTRAAPDTRGERCRRRANRRSGTSTAAT